MATENHEHAHGLHDGSDTGRGPPAVSASDIDLAGFQALQEIIQDLALTFSAGDGDADLLAAPRGLAAGSPIQQCIDENCNPPPVVTGNPGADFQLCAWDCLLETLLGGSTRVVGIFGGDDVFGNRFAFSLDEGSDTGRGTPAVNDIWA